MKIALITGGMGGIGTEICKTLANDGHTVVTTYTGNQDKKAAFDQHMAQNKLKAYSYQCDITDFAACENLINTIKTNLGDISILVNNAGITKDSTFKKMSKDAWDSVINTNLTSMFNITKHVVDGMINQGFGRIINISSINGQKGQFGQANYSAAKAGVHGFTMALAQEVAKKGVTVNTIAPGYIATDMVMAIPEEVRNKIIANIPIGRLGQPQEIAALISYLASDNSGFMTGSILAINGGQHMG